MFCNLTLVTVGSCVSGITLTVVRANSVDTHSMGTVEEIGLAFVDVLRKREKKNDNKCFFS
jgi:hypothetical protein